ncbi:hypothetical protein PLICRDRAFT_533714 [Plicaturopsis crispa FD-325 SS-3]|nr:hypothetical protein PLICRDRAFT_533714 [Plicaturopsis crispa FD-325 SS-3]
MCTDLSLPSQLFSAAFPTSFHTYICSVIPAALVCSFGACMLIYALRQVSPSSSRASGPRKLWLGWKIVPRREEGKGKRELCVCRKPTVPEIASHRIVSCSEPALLVSTCTIASVNEGSGIRN